MSEEKKNPAAVALGKARWSGVSDEERSRAMARLGRQAAATMTAKQRLARAKKASRAAKKARKLRSQAATAKGLTTQSEK